MGKTTWLPLAVALLSLLVGASAPADPVAWDGAALWTLDQELDSFTLYRVDPVDSSVLSSCDIATQNPDHPAVTESPNVGEFPSQLEWTGSALRVSTDLASSPNWVVEVDTDCNILSAFQEDRATLGGNELVANGTLPDCQCAILNVQTPGGGFVARLRNTSPGLLGNGSTSSRFVRTSFQLVGSECPDSVETSLTVRATDEEGDNVPGSPARAIVTCELGRSNQTSVDVVYTAGNCPGGSGPDPGQATEMGLIDLSATIEAAGSSTTRDTLEFSKGIQCKPSK